MILPPDNSITLAANNGELVVDHTDRPAATFDSALQLLPGWARDPVAGIRDGLVTAYQGMASLAWARIGQALARFISPRLADGPWLDEWGQMYQRSRVAGESDADYRARLLTPRDAVSPNAIRNALKTLIAQVTVLQGAFLEPATDAAFASSTSLSCPWAAFVQPNSVRLWASYPDNQNPTVGAYAVEVPPVSVNGDAVKPRAEFWVVLPGDAGEGEPVAFSDPIIWPGADYTTTASDFVAPSTSAFAHVFAQPDSLLERVRSDVEQRRAGGVVWFGFLDPVLVNGSR